MAMERNNQLIKHIVKLKKENENLEQLINFLRIENFEYALKCNHIENTILNIKAIAKKIPGDLLDTSDNICNILQICGSSKVDNTILNAGVSVFEKTKTPIGGGKRDSCNKAHVVKPHMVNGHILYIPTINLTRVPELQSSSNIQGIENNSSVRSGSTDNTDCGVSQRSLNRFVDNNEIEAETNDSTQSNDFNDDNTLTHREQVDEASSSKSPSHSTVLSGTFQEVKIYLNQVRPESLNEESARLIRKSRHKAKVSTSPRQNRRSGNQFEGITERKRRR